jgi:hypothetical protein
MRFSVIFAVSCACTPALASDGGMPPGAPQLSGNYVLTLINNCVQSGSSVSQTTGTANFDPTTGQLNFSGYDADGNPITLIKISGSGPYLNDSKTVTFAGTTYKAFYGPVKQGIAQYVSMIAIVAGGSGNCANQATLVHQ